MIRFIHCFSQQKQHQNQTCCIQQIFITERVLTEHFYSSFHLNSHVFDLFTSKSSQNNEINFGQLEEDQRGEAREIEIKHQ